MSEHPMPTRGSDIVFRNVDQAIAEQRAKGLRKYGVPLGPFNGRSAKRDRRAEIIDELHYLEQDILQEEAIKAKLREALHELTLGRVAGTRWALTEAIAMLEGRAPCP